MTLHVPDAHPERIAYLDGWRGLAIATLLAGHFLHLPGINVGRVGVDLFFVLSGQLMAKILFVQAVPLGDFYRRRISRIFPAAYVFLAVIMVCYLPGLNAMTAGPLAGVFLFVSNYFPARTYVDLGLPVGHLWSLCVEEHGYVLLSLLALYQRRFGGPVLRLLLVLVLASVGMMAIYTWGLHWRSADIYIRSETAVLAILMSAGLTLWLARQADLRVPWPLIPAALVAGVMLQWWSLPPILQHSLGVGLLALGFNLLPYGPIQFRQMLAWAPLRGLGTISFSVYLWQQPLYLAKGIPAAVAIPLALLAGLLSYRLIEQPARTFLNRRWRGSGAARPNETVTVPLA